MTTTTSQRQHIDISAIERELAALWKQSDDGDGPQVTRACVMTLIAPVQGLSAAQDAAAVIVRLTDRFPNRAIVIDSAPEQQADSLDAWVQANCQLPAAGRTQICCEQITIDARGVAVARVPGTVLPLLVPDVPVVLWWPQGNPLGSPLFERLSALANRVIIDSASFSEPEPQLRTLLTTFGARSRVSDLAWGRLTPWRELIAQFFDSPANVPHLHAACRVTVQYDAPATTLDRVQPLMFVGWLAAKLEWQATAPIEERPDAAFTLRRPDGGTVEILLVPAPLATPDAARLAAVELRCAEATFQVERSSAVNCAMATAQIGNAAPLRRVVRLERSDTAELLAEELRLFGRDRGYEGALRAAATMVS